jgi:hypothetical protein
MNQFEHSIYNIRFSTFQTITMNFEQPTTNHEQQHANKLET